MNNYDKIALGAGVFLLAAGALMNNITYALCGIGYILCVQTYVMYEGNVKIEKE
jgi:hypothetical protein